VREWREGARIRAGRGRRVSADQVDLAAVSALVLVLAEQIALAARIPFSVQLNFQRHLHGTGARHACNTTDGSSSHAPVGREGRRALSMRGKW